MKFETTPRFTKDWQGLAAEHRAVFRSLMPAFSAACDEYVAKPGGFRWPGALRVRRMASAQGIWEMAWSSSGPDGRATFEFLVIDGAPAVRWRRIGRHAIFGNP